jgi:2-dehydro-3-deoxy-D-arabinonate dehydratase
MLEAAMTVSLVRYYLPDHGPQLGIEQDGAVSAITAQFNSVADWLRASVNHVGDAIDALANIAKSAPVKYDATVFDNPPAPEIPHWLAPVDTQDVWATGVSYVRSRAARQEEAIDGGDIYARVYDADRPELFFKAHGRQAVGHLDTAGIRRDATWSVPEPELAVVLNPALEIVGFTAGNDMSSRDIEGENPLYLPQAKSYRRACALGPGIVLMPQTSLPVVAIEITIIRDGKTMFQDRTSSSNIKRSAAELIDYLGRCMDFPDGVVLLTGTGIVPPSDFTLQAADTVRIAIEGIGTLVNPVAVV